MKDKMLIKKITGIAMLSVVVVIVELISNHITFGPVNITLALIPIVIGAIIFGPFAGFILGMVEGVIVLLAPATQAAFMPFNAFATILVCLLKTAIAGMVSGFVFKAFKNIHFNLAIILAAIVVPIINTGLFALACMTIFLPLIKSYAGEGANVYAYLFLTFIGINFVIEFLVNSLLSPAIIKIIKLVQKNYQNRSKKEIPNE